MNYQKIVDAVRAWNLKGWPNKTPVKRVGSPAWSKYPNIAAELGTHLWLYLMAEFACVSSEIMAAVIEDGEELTAAEQARLAAAWGADAGYMFAPVLAVIDPATNKGKARRETLRATIREHGHFFKDYELAHFKRTLADLDAGKKITYARWRYAMDELTEAAASYRRQELRRASTRTKRTA